MFASLAAKTALKKYGISKDLFDFSPSELAGGQPRREPNKLRKPRPDDLDDEDEPGSWSSWMSVRNLPLAVQPWLAPPPPAVDVARSTPGIGDRAPEPRGEGVAEVRWRGERSLVVFLRCAGCACKWKIGDGTWLMGVVAQKTFLALRTLGNRYPDIHCIAISHSSAEATRRWVDMMGGAWAVRVVVDEERALYAAWGLGTGGVWYLLNPATQVQGWKEKGWLGDKVAGAIKTEVKSVERKDDDEEEDGPLTTMGNKWQEAGAFAVDGSGTVIWGGKAARADDVMNLEEGARLLLA